jgi:hypothetical protein
MEKNVLKSCCSKTVPIDKAGTNHTENCRIQHLQPRASCKIALFILILGGSMWLCDVDNGDLLDYRGAAAGCHCSITICSISAVEYHARKRRRQQLYYRKISLLTELFITRLTPSSTGNWRSRIWFLDWQKPIVTGFSAIPASDGLDFDRLWDAAVNVLLLLLTVYI